MNSSPQDIERSERTVTEAVAAPVAARRGPQSLWVEVLMELGALDRAVYQADATTPTAHLDRPLRRLSRAADAGALWLVIAGGVAATRGAPGRRVASEAVTSLAVTVITVNLGAKSIFRRRRPDRTGHDRTPARRCRPRARARSHPGTRQHRSPSPTPSVATSPSSASPYGSSPRRSPTHVCTSACTTQATSSSAPSWVPEPPPHRLSLGSSAPIVTQLTGPPFGQPPNPAAQAPRTERQHRVRWSPPSPAHRSAWT